MASWVACNPVLGQADVLGVTTFVKRVVSACPRGCKERDEGAWPSVGLSAVVRCWPYGSKREEDGGLGKK